MLEPILVLGFIALLSAIVVVHGVKSTITKKRLDEVAQETDQAKLTELAKNDKLPDNVREMAAHKISDPKARQEILNGITAYLMRSPMTKPYQAKESTNPYALRDSMCHARPMDSHSSSHHWILEETQEDEGKTYEMYKCKHCGVKDYRLAEPRNEEH